MTDRHTGRRYLGGLAVAVLAGCLSGNDGSVGGGPAETDAGSGKGPSERDATGTATASARPTGGPLPTPAPDACPPEPRLPETVVSSEELPSVPEQPESLDDEAAVRRYVEDFEYAYKYRTMAGYGIVEFNLDMSVEVAARGTDWVVVTADYAMDHGRWDDGDGTPHGYFDGHRYAFGYLVTSEGVWRASRRETGSPPDPRSEGTLLQCFDG